MLVSLSSSITSGSLKDLVPGELLRVIYTAKKTTSTTGKRGALIILTQAHYTEFAMNEL